jgi:hypothetical protein
VNLAAQNAVEAFEGDDDNELDQGDDKIIDMVAKDGVYSETPTVPGPEST